MEGEGCEVDGEGGRGVDGGGSHMKVLSHMKVAAITTGVEGGGRELGHI